MLVYVENVQIS